MNKGQIFLCCLMPVPMLVGFTMPFFRPSNILNITQDKDFKDTSASDEHYNKYASQYKNYLAAAVDKNKEFFDYVYKWWYSSKNYKGRFGKITKGAGTDDGSIQKTCKDAYKEDKIDVSSSKIKKYGTSENIEDTDFREEDIWALCSIRGYRIRTIAEAGEEGYYEENAYGKKYKEKLVSGHATGTGGFWDLGYNWRTDAKNNTKDTTTFEKVFKAKKEDNERRKRWITRSRYRWEYNLDRNMMKACRKAYYVKESDSNPLYPKEQVLKYCALIPETMATGQSI